MKLRGTRQTEETRNCGAELPPHLPLHVPQCTDNTHSEGSSDCPEHIKICLKCLKTKRQHCFYTTVDWKVPSSEILVLYLSAARRILVHPAERTATQQGSRAWRETGGQGKSVAPHQGTHDGHTARHDRLCYQQLQYSHSLIKKMHFGCKLHLLMMMIIIIKSSKTATKLMKYVYRMTK